MSLAGIEPLSARPKAETLPLFYRDNYVLSSTFFPCLRTTDARLISLCVCGYQKPNVHATRSPTFPHPYDSITINLRFNCRGHLVPPVPRHGGV